MKNKLVPKLRFPEFVDVSWFETTLGKTGNIVTGKTPSTQDARLWGGDVLFITPTDMDGGKYQVRTARTVHRNLSIRVLPKGSISYTCIASIGKISITAKDSITNQQINSIIVDENVNNEFLYYYLLNITPYIKSTPASSTLAIINKTEFSAIKIFLPSEKPEQQKIADCLSTLDDLIGAETEKLDALKQHKKGLMQQLFPAEGEKLPKLRFPEFTDSGEWEIDALCSKEVAEFINKKVDFGKLNIATYVSTENLLPNYAGVETSAKLPSSGSFTEYGKEDILVSNIRPYLKKVWFSDRDGTTSNDVIVIRAKAKLNSSFLSHLLINDIFIDYIMKSAEGVKMPRGDKDAIRKYQLVFPKKEEQQKIANCLSSLDEQILTQTKKIEDLKLHKKGLMQGLFPHIN